MRGLHWIAQHANTADADLDDVPGYERPDACGRACGNQISGKKSHHAGNPAHQKRNRVSHQRGAPGLAASSVDVCLYQDLRWVELRLDVRTDRTKSIEALRARKLHVTLLQVARSHVVQTAVAEKIGERIVAVFEV